MKDITNAKLPPVFKRNGKDCYRDPIRDKLIYVTPEETIRQQVLSYLINTLEVPAEMIDVEVPLSHFGLKTRKRADIVILGRDKNDKDHPLTVIECKKDTASLDERAEEQVFGYSDDLISIYTVLTNGHLTYCYKYDETKKKYIEIEQLPKYEDMLTGEFVPVEPVKPKERIPYERLEEKLQNSNNIKSEIYPRYFIHKCTSPELALPCFNLLEGLFDYSVKMSAGNYGLFELLQDCGVRKLTYGNASGGQCEGYYRSFLVKVGENTEFYSLSFNTYRDLDDERSGNRTNTILCVAHDDEKTYHHALQLSIDQFAVANGKTIEFYHNGRITVGNLGSGKSSELKELVEKRYPKIVMGDKYYLGSITADHLLRLDEPDVINLIVNLISYSIVRDEFREIVKNRYDRANSQE